MMENRKSQIKISWLKKEMRQLYPAPHPERKENFLREFPYPAASKWEVIQVQMGYIRRMVWALSLLLVGAVLAAGESGWWNNTSYDVLWRLSAIMPVLAVLVVTETFRSSVYGMAEMEMAAKHHLPQVLLIRMGIMGGVDFLLILLGIPFVVKEGAIGVFRTLIYLLVPYLCTCVLMLQIKKYKRGKDAVWSCICWGIFISGINLISRVLQEKIYDGGVFYLWVCGLLFLLFSLYRQIKEMLHGMEEWEWNLYLTE